MQFGLDENIIEQIQKVFESNPKVDEVLVFGSRAKGNYRPDSDIDLAVKGRNISFDDITGLSVQLDQLNLPYKIDLINYATVTDKDVLEHIDRVGIVFYQRWKKLKLVDLLRFGNGKVRPGSEGKIPVYGGNGILGYTDESNYDDETIIIGRVGAYCGSVYYNKGPVWVSDNALAAKPKNGFSAKFLYYFLRHLDLNQFAEGSSHPLVTQSLLNSIDVAVTDNPKEQITIASILRSLDDKIDLLHRQNKTLEQLAETLFRQWFVEEAGTDSDTIKISDVADINSKNISNGYPYSEIEYLDTGSITQGVISGFQMYNLSDAPSRAQRIVKENDIVYSLVRPIQRHYGLLHNIKPNTIVSTGFCVITCRNINPYFIYLLLTRDETIDYFDSVAEGSTSAYPSLKPSDISNFEFPKPPEEKLTAFSNFVTETWNKIKANQKQIKTLTQLRDTLLPKLMSGEVRVEMSEL
ncbi:restriction endonuclease subunit S [Terrimonas pollutisoli]|uniref:restriction endonuclease subunit S n=1 Tax=Terrimonas pollutisoli TaxID=3034147 RepID=UPI0023EDEEAC|nr:restriction endonuclease subunit S [Terrimonas sp. H1YJ31]